MSLLGSELTRLDAFDKASGKALYTQDLQVEGMLHGAIVRSRHPSAVILGIDTRSAAAAPGVACVLTAGDLPDRRYGIILPDEPVLARDVVRYVGEPVALVAATSRAEALEAAALVDVRYDVRPAVTHLLEAVAPEAPRVHAASANLVDSGAIRRGDVDGAFAGAALVVETELASQRAHQAYIEPRASLAQLVDDRVRVTTTSQAPFEVRMGIAELFDLPIARVGVKVPALGGGFGGKLHLGMAPFAVALALHTRRPVQVLCTRADEMQSPAPRENSFVRLTSAIDERGRITARRALIYMDAGAYAYDTTALHAVAAHQACGPYEIDNVDLVAGTVYTNTVPTGSFRAPSGPQMAYAHESHMEEIAERLQTPSLDLRRRHVVRDGSLGPGGQTLADPGAATCLQRATEVLGRWEREPLAPPPPGVRRGTGIGLCWWNTYPGGSAANVTLAEDGSVFVNTGATEIGTGAVTTALRALVADELGVGLGDVHVTSGDTDLGPWDFGSQGSRTMYAAGGAAKRAAGTVRQIVAEHLADELEASPDDIVFQDGTVGVAGSPDARPLADVARAIAATSGPVTASGRFQPTPPAPQAGCIQDLVTSSFNEPTYHCHVAEVDVDEATGLVDVRRYAAIHDIGPVLNPIGARGQIEGGMVQGLGYALYEEIVYDDEGRALNDNLVDYRLPTIADVPDELEVITVTEHPGTHGPSGAKGIGEAPIIPVAAAIGSAVRDAVGAQPAVLPMRADRIRAPIAGRRG